MSDTIPADINPPADTSSTPEQREIALAVLQTILELGEPEYAGPRSFVERITSWVVGEGTLYESSVTRRDWESDELFHLNAGTIWRRGMAYEILKRMDLDRDTKNAVIKLVWAILPNPGVLAVLLAYAPGERPVTLTDMTPAPKVLSEAAQRSRAMIEYQFGGLQRIPESGKVEPTPAKSARAPWPRSHHL